MTAIVLNSGRLFNFEEPDPSDIDIIDVAHSLSNLCRFNGHTNYFYSIAQHCCVVADLVDGSDKKREALLHDGPEFVLGDVTTPLKAALPDYKLKEDRVAVAFSKKFLIPEKMSPEVKMADYHAYILEVNSLFSVKPDVVQKQINDAVNDGLKLFPIKPLQPNEARQLFLRYYVNLFGY